MISEQNLPDQFHQGYPNMPRQQEDSTFLRWLSILTQNAQKVQGDSEIDVDRMMIMLSPLWIAEGKSQESIHERYSVITNYLLSILVGYIMDIKDKDKQKTANDEFNEIDTKLNTCDIVTVSMSRGENTLDRGEVKIKTYVSFRKLDDMENIDSDQGVVSYKKLKDAEIISSTGWYEQGLHCANENGFRVANCTIRHIYYDAMKLAYTVGYLKPEYKLKIRGAGPRSEDFTGGQ
jgi:hypothetical protein